MGTVFITGVEFIFGCIFNISLGMNVWNYDNMLFNLLGQICLPFSLLCVPVFKWIVNDKLYCRFA